MNIYQKGKSKYITSLLDMKDYNISTGHFKRHLDAFYVSLADYFQKYEMVIRDNCRESDFKKNPKKVIEECLNWLKQ